MRTLSVALILVAAASLTACSDLTRPNEILIIAEPPPVAKPTAPPAAAAKAAPAEAPQEQGSKPAAKAGG